MTFSVDSDVIVELGDRSSIPATLHVAILQYLYTFGNANANMEGFTSKYQFWRDMALSSKIRCEYAGLHATSH